MFSVLIFQIIMSYDLCLEMARLRFFFASLFKAGPDAARIPYTTWESGRELLHAFVIYMLAATVLIWLLTRLPTSSHHALVCIPKPGWDLEHRVLCVQSRGGSHSMHVGVI